TARGEVFRPALPPYTLLFRPAGPEGQGGCFDSPSLGPLDSLPTRNDQGGALDPKEEGRSGRLAEKALYCALEELRIAFSGRQPPAAPISYARPAGAPASNTQKNPRPGFRAGIPLSGGLLILVHFFVVLLVVARGDVVHPVLVGQVPVDGQDDALFKGGLGVPAQVVLDLGGVDAVAAVVAQTVGHVLDEVLADAVVLQTVVELGDDGLDDEDVGPLVVAAHVVHLADFAALGHHIDGLAVVLHIQPVPDLHPVAVHRQLLVVLDVVDHEWDQLFGEVVGPVVVGAAGDVDGHPVGVVEGHDEQVGAGLGGRIGAVGRQRGGLGEVALGTQRAVHLVGGDLQVFLARLPGLGGGVVRSEEHTSELQS